MLEEGGEGFILLHRAGELGQAIPFGLFAYEPMPEEAASGAVSVRVVREDGRWFVSPVGTVLAAIDNFVERADERTIYPVIGLGYKLPPDATLTLNQPLRLGAAVAHQQVFAFDGQAGQINYAASKSALVGFARSLTRELGGRGITANVVAPGFIETDMTAELSADTQAEYKKNIPAGRFATADEVAGVVAWIASDDAAYISGAVIPVDGGLGMGH